MSRQSRSWRAADDGAAAAEAALVMTVLLLLVTGSIEFAQALWTNNTMLLAVEEAAATRWSTARANPRPAQPRRKPRIALRCPLPQSPIVPPGRPSRSCLLTRPPNIGVSVSEDTTSTPATVTICASYSFNFLAPQLLPYNLLDLNVRVTVPLL